MSLQFNPVLRTLFSVLELILPFIGAFAVGFSPVYVEKVDVAVEVVSSICRSLVMGEATGRWVTRNIRKVERFAKIFVRAV